MNLRDRFVSRFFSDQLDQRARLAAEERDGYWIQVLGSAGGPQDRPWAELQTGHEDALDAWRTNPLAKRFVDLVTDFVVGSGINIFSENAAVNRFLQDWLTHPKNAILSPDGTPGWRIYQLCDELTRAGELFITLHTNPADGMTYLRPIPARQIQRVDTDPDDYERETVAWQVLAGSPSEGKPWPIYDPADDDPTRPAMLHYAVNRAVGAVRGESDLSCNLKWLRRYSSWLEDRVRINRYRTAFVWDVTVPNNQVPQKAQEYQNPPESGSIRVHGPDEVWDVKTPQIRGEDAKEDGKAIRMMVATGMGIPPHFLSDPESATQATAREANLPTYQHLEARQNYYRYILADLAAVAVRRRNAARRLGQGLPQDLKIKTSATDLTHEDFQALSSSLNQTVQALAAMADRGWVDDETAVSTAFEFAGRLVRPEEILEKVRKQEPAREIAPPADAQPPEQEHPS